MYLIVGLGNPGAEYEKTRHNVGFDVIDKLSEKYDIKITKQKFEGLYGNGEIEGKKVILLKPQTYMNLSGNSIAKFKNFYKISEESIIVIYDDIDVKVESIKIRKKGSAGTHNGMKSVISQLGTDNFPRIRIGTSPERNIYDLANYVLEKVGKDEYLKLEKGINFAAESIGEILKSGIDKAMNKFN